MEIMFNFESLTVKVIWKIFDFYSRVSSQLTFFGSKSTIETNTKKNVNEICPKLTIKTPEQCHWLCTGKC